MTDSDWTPQEHEESFGVIVFRDSSDPKEVLLVRVKSWGFPKGHAEEGEDGPTAAVREVKEETGISATIADPSVQHVEQYELRRERFTTKKTVTYWVGSGNGEPCPKEGEISETRWVAVTEAMTLLTHESAKHILKSLL